MWPENQSNDNLFSKSRMARGESWSYHLHINRWTATRCDTSTTQFHFVRGECWCDWNATEINFLKIDSLWCPLKLKAPTDGNCVDDQFIVAGQNLNNPLPTICGINSGQHSKSIRITVRMIWTFSTFHSLILECSVRRGRQCHGSKSIFIDFNHSGCGAGIQHTSEPGKEFDACISLHDIYLNDISFLTIVCSWLVVPVRRVIACNITPNQKDGCNRSTMMTHLNL